MDKIKPNAKDENRIIYCYRGHTCYFTNCNERLSQNINYTKFQCDGCATIYGGEYYCYHCSECDKYDDAIGFGIGCGFDHR